MTSPRWSEISIVMRGIYGENGATAQRYELPSMSKFLVGDCSCVIFARCTFICVFVCNGNELVTISFVSDFLESFSVCLPCIFILLNTCTLYFDWFAAVVVGCSRHISNELPVPPTKQAV